MMELGKIISYKKGKAPTNIKINNEYVVYLSPEYLRSKSKEIIIPDFYGKVEVSEGDLLLLWDGSNAGEFFLGKKGVLSSTMVKLIFDEKENNKSFLYYQLKFIEDYLKSQTNGSGIPHVDKEILLSINVERFKPTEQRQIATILSKVDEAISQTEKLITKYQRIKTGLMQDLLTKGIDEHGNIRSEETHEFKDSPLGRIPVEWEVFPLSELCGLIVDCKNRTCPFIEKSEFPVIRTSNIRNGKLVWDDMKYTDQGSYKIWTDRAVPFEDDVIITREAPLGQVLKIPYGLTPVLGQRTMLFRVDKNNLLSDFLVYSIIDNKMQKYLNSISGGSTVHHLKVGEMKSILISHPKSVIEQQEIIDRLNVQEDAIKILENKYSKLHSIKTGLMQDLLSGKVRVNHLLKETEMV